MGYINKKRLSRFWRAWIFAYRNTLGRNLPHGIVSLRYLLPCQSRKIQIHRHVWLQGLPLVPFPLYIVMEICLWLRWTLFSGWRGTLRAVRRLGPEIRDREGIGILTQFKRMLGIALFHCVHPSEVYAFRLYRRGQKAHVWDYVFTHELPAFHRWRDSRHGEIGKSLELLGDKRRSTKMLRKHGVPVVPVLEMVPQGTDFDPSACLKEYSRLFCKPRNGSAGRGCFVVERQDANAALIVYKTKAGAVTEQSTWSCLLKAAARDDYLIQPFMANHSALAGLCETEDAITVRIITEVQDSATVRYYCAMLEIPGPRKNPKSGKKGKTVERFHVILPIDETNGKTIRLDADALPPSAMTYHNELYSKAENRPVPFWDELKKSALASHALFRDIYAIAWDYVVTSEGPRLLEGNTGWGTRMPQIINGGILS